MLPWHWKIKLTKVLSLVQVFYVRRNLFFIIPPLSESFTNDFLSVI